MLITKEATFKNIANAIRRKGGTNEPIIVRDMAQAIMNIEGGGGISYPVECNLITPLKFRYESTLGSKTGRLTCGDDFIDISQSIIPPDKQDYVWGTLGDIEIVQRGNAYAYSIRCNKPNIIIVATRYKDFNRSESDSLQWFFSEQQYFSPVSINPGVHGEFFEFNLYYVGEE